MGYNRKVFYSNVGAPREIIRSTSRAITPLLEELRHNEDNIKTALSNEHVARRFETLLDDASAETKILQDPYLEATVKKKISSQEIFG